MHEYIEIVGARENNLKSVTLRIPKRKITVFTGVSGSGKSSMVFSTIAAESQRLLNDNFSMFVRNFLPKIRPPEVHEINNLSMAVIVDQKPLGGGSHSTVGTITDIAPVMRLLLSTCGTPKIGSPNVFSFNDPEGMCPKCQGTGQAIGLNLDTAIDMNKSINEGALLLPFIGNQAAYMKMMAATLFDIDRKLSSFNKDELEQLLYGEPQLVDFGGGLKGEFEGVAHRFTRKYATAKQNGASGSIPRNLARFIAMRTCPSCLGARLNSRALTCKINGYNIAELSSLEVTELISVLDTIKQPHAAPLISLLNSRLSNLVAIGLGYLSLDRASNSLSGGESQRVKMVKHLNGSLADVTYIFDEPSVGLHPRDVHRLNELLQKLRDKGNTIIVVEHDPDVIKIADHIVDMGPGAGSKGGQVVFEGTYQDLLHADTLTGTHLSQKLPIKTNFRTATDSLAISGARSNNLKNIDVNIPVGILTVVTGVAGSGKSSLINQAFLQQHPEAIVINQSPVSANRRSNPATYTGIMDDIRKAFAKVNQVDASLFSFNSKGACGHCQGVGVIYMDLAFLGDVKTLCESCQGKRFKQDVLAYLMNSKSISEVLELTITQAIDYFEHPEILRKLQALQDVGLGYLTLGQPLDTLSGGECQRIKLASELHKRGSIYVMDEPTTGLHPSDIAHLLAMLNRIVDSGNTVVVIEHNLDVIRNADWIIDMGPESGQGGGRALFAGRPDKLQQAEESITRRFL